MKTIFTKTVLMYVILLFTTITTNVQAQWVFTNALPTAHQRYAASAFSIGDTAYIIGGLPSNGVCCWQEMWKNYGNCTGSWTSGTYPTNAPARVSASTFVINGKGYYGLGSVYGTNTYFSDFWIYNSTLGWQATALAPAFPGTARADAISIVCNNKAYIFFGVDVNGPLNDAYEFDGTSWAQLPVPTFTITPRFGGVGFSLNGKCYIGFGENGFSASNGFYEYDPSNSTWTDLTVVSNPPPARSHAAYFSDSSFGYMVCGNNASLHANFPDTWVFNSANDTWTQWQQNFIGSSRVYQVGFTIGNCGFVGTGGDSVGGNLTNFTGGIWRFCGINGINEIMQSANTIQVYPNPANTILNIHQSTQSTNQLIITDLLGTEVYKEILTGVDNTISISTWSAGIYFYEVRGSGLQIPTSVRGKFVVQK